MPQDIEKFYWTDSQTALRWITNEKPWKQYVHHRVTEIRRLTAKDEWKYCPGKLNPADLLSRGLTGNELLKASTWWKGPQFLQLLESEWPSDQTATETNEIALTELVKTPLKVTHVFACTEEIPAEIDLSKLIKCEEFSSLDRLLRVTAYVIRFVNKLWRHVSARKLKNAPPDESTSQNDHLELNASEIRAVESLWIQTVQANAFPSEYNFLRNLDHRKPQRVDQFDLYLDEKIIRCRGRINNSTLPSDNKNPILLPSKHHLVDLVILATHARVKHSSVNNTLTTIRERFWILRGRQAVKRILRHCVTCRKLDGLSYNSHESPDLPSIRVSQDPPFTHTGVDFAGPLYIRLEGNDDVNNDKCYQFNEK